MAWRALEKLNYERKESEKNNLVFRRSLHVIKDIKTGEKFTPENVRSIRPSFGLASKNINDVYNSSAKENINNGNNLP